MPFETYFDEMASMAFVGAPDYKIVFYEMDENNFILFADCQSSFGGRALSKAVYRGASLPVILDYSSLSEEMEGSASLKDYLQSTFSTNGKVSAEDVEKVKTELNTYKTRTAAIDRMKKFTNIYSFNVLSLISNTTADIDFDEYAAEYTPAGATPLICYVREMGTKTLNNTFGTGYVQRLAYLVAYLDSEGKLHIKKGAVIVPWYTNSTDEYSYSLALGEEGKDYVTIQEEIISTLEDPIISEWLLPNA